VRVRDDLTVAAERGEQAGLSAVRGTASSQHPTAVDFGLTGISSSKDVGALDDGLSQ
jgi:hypothetical protein